MTIYSFMVIDLLKKMKQYKKNTGQSLACPVSDTSQIANQSSFYLYDQVAGNLPKPLGIGNA